MFASANGASGPTVSVNKAALLSALTINRQESQKALVKAYQSKGYRTSPFLCSGDISEVISLTDVSVGVFTQAIQNIATLRADNGGSMSRLRFASDDVALQKTNMIAANGRIKDVDIATESEPGEISGTRSGIRIDARSGQHNSDIALMLLR